jgi:hypothetical protein
MKTDLHISVGSCPATLYKIDDNSAGFVGARVYS